MDQAGHTVKNSVRKAGGAGDSGRKLTERVDFGRELAGHFDGF